MTPPVNFTIGKGVLLPQGDAAREALLEQPIGTVVEVDVLDPTDAPLRHKIFAAIDILAKWRAVPLDEMRAQVLLALGRAKYIRKHNGAQCWVLESMDRRALKGPELQKFWRDFQNWLMSEKIQPTLPHDVAERLRLMIDEPASEDR